MGYEAECACRWGDSAATVRALLESSELILRGDLRRRVPFVAMADVRVEADSLCFRTGEQAVAIYLGSATALRWAQRIAAPPRTLAQKLGVSQNTGIWSWAVPRDEALRLAISAGTPRDLSRADLLLAEVHTPDDLQSVLTQTAHAVERGAALWLAYPKGPGHALSEQAVLAAGRHAGWTDTKVASVSPILTALRFVARQKPRTAKPQLAPSRREVS